MSNIELVLHFGQFSLQDLSTPRHSSQNIGTDEKTYWKTVTAPVSV